MKQKVTYMNSVFNDQSKNWQPVIFDMPQNPFLWSLIFFTQINALLKEKDQMLSFWLMARPFFQLL